MGVNYLAGVKVAMKFNVVVVYYSAHMKCGSYIGFTLVTSPKVEKVQFFKHYFFTKIYHKILKNHLFTKELSMI